MALRPEDIEHAIRLRDEAKALDEALDLLERRVDAPVVTMVVALKHREGRAEIEMGTDAAHKLLRETRRVLRRDALDIGLAIPVRAEDPDNNVVNMGAIADAIKP